MCDISEEKPSKTIGELSKALSSEARQKWLANIAVKFTLPQQLRRNRGVSTNLD